MTKISNCPHKDELCLISLTTDLRKKMTNKGYDPDDAIKNLKGIGVDVCDLSIQSLSKIEQYKVVIIICHHIKSQDNDALVLSDNTFLPVDVFVHTISTEFTGLLDLAICDSKAMAYEIKALSKYPDALKIQYAEEETDVEFRLCYIYPNFLKNFSFAQIDDYKQRYREAYLEAIEEAEREQKEKVKDINLLPAGTKLGDSTESSNDSINTSVFMPKEVTRGEFFKLQIKMHLDIDTGTLYLEDAEGNDPNTVQRKKNVAIKNIQIGDELTLNFCFLDGEDRDPIPTEQIKIKKELNKEELNSIDNIYTLGITINEENQTLVLHVKIANEYTDSKFFTIIKFVKDGKLLIEPFDLETGFKSGNSHSVSNINRPDANWGNQYKPGRIVEQFKAGRPFGSLFREDDDKEKWAKIFIDFLKNHESQHDFTIKANKQDYLSIAFVSFYIRWLQIKIKKDGKEKSIVFEDQRPNGPACFRFLTEDCGVKYCIKGKNPINQYGNFIRDEIVDRTAGKKSSYKKIRDKTKEVDEEVSNWFSEHKLKLG